MNFNSFKFIFLLLIFLVAFSSPAPLDGISYIFPKPEAELVSASTTLIVSLQTAKGVEESPYPELFIVIGSLSGLHYGQTELSDDHKRLLFKPDIPFSANETVTVRLSLAQFGLDDLTYRFYVSPQHQAEFRRNYDELPSIQKDDAPIVDQVTTINGVAVPGDFPHIETIRYGTSAPGRIFFASTFGNLGNYLVICENDGTPYFYRKYPKGSLGSGDFKLQPTGVLTHYQYKFEHYIALDHHYVEIDTFKCKHGFITDSHELLLTPDGHALMVAEDPQRIDMRRYISDGNSNALVWGNHVQELDSNGNVVFEWRSWDNYNIMDMVDGSLKAAELDYVHMNSIAFDYDGQLIISVRNLSEVTKINHETGEIIWRLGGKNNQFTFINDPIAFSLQHDAQPVPGKPNHYTIFDNGTYHTPSFSRAVEYKLDPVQKTAELVWQYCFNPSRYSSMMGNVQKLANGNSFIDASNWPPGYAVEVNKFGELIFAMNVNSTSSYRTKRFEWEGMVDAPYLIAEPSNYQVAFVFNKFGDTTVRSYKIYGDHSPKPTTLLAETDQTFMYLDALENNTTYYFRVTAVNSNGSESAYSNIEKVQVKFVPLGVNMVSNGDFLKGFDGWEWLVRGGDASYEITSTGELHFIIHNGGSQIWEIQATRPGLQLVQGAKYLFEFDAYADGNRAIEAEVRKNGDPWTNHSKMGLTALSRARKHYTREFIMQEPSEPQARIVINVGTSELDVYIDNVSLKRVTKSLVSERDTQPDLFFSSQNFPNPFNAGTRIDLKIPRKSFVSLKVYNMKGQQVRSLVNEEKGYGDYQVHWDGKDDLGHQVGSGLYVYNLLVDTHSQFVKMLLLR